MAVVFMTARRTDSADYGWFIREMMAAHRISSQLELSRAVRSAGYPISQPALSKVIGGKTEPSRKLHRALVVAMDLSPEETREFNDIFALADTDIVLTEENRQGMGEIDDEVKRAVEDKSKSSGEERSADRKQ